jgi:glycosidase
MAGLINDSSDTAQTHKNTRFEHKSYHLSAKAVAPEWRVEADLPRICSLGVDVIWFMPIHPIGTVARKGSLGSPYAIQGYREVNPKYGSRQEFFRLVEYAHTLGLKVMIDVVHNI